MKKQILFLLLLVTTTTFQPAFGMSNKEKEELLNKALTDVKCSVMLLQLDIHPNLPKFGDYFSDCVSDERPQTAIKAAMEKCSSPAHSLMPFGDCVSFEMLPVEEKQKIVQRNKARYEKALSLFENSTVSRKN